MDLNYEKMWRTLKAESGHHDIRRFSGEQTCVKTLMLHMEKRAKEEFERLGYVSE